MSLPIFDRILAAACVAALFWVAGCDTQGAQDRFADEAARAPDGYTETNSSGEIINADADDWRTSPVYRGRITVDPAFPNPVSAEIVSLPLTIIGFDGVRGGALTIRAYDVDRVSLIGLADPIEITGPGSYSFRFSTGRLTTKGMHRVFVFDLGGELVTYGDLLVQ